MYYTHIIEEEVMTNKEKLKVRRHFSYSLLSAAVGMLSSSGGDGIWEELEVAQLVMLIAQQLDISTTTKMIKLLQKTTCATPGIIQYIMNENPFKIQFHFQPEEVISAYTAVSTSMSQIINRIIESVEVGIFNLNDLNTVHQLLLFATSRDMLLQDRKKFCMQLCSVADSKRVCGLITNIFTADLSVQESAHFIFDIVSSDNFLDMQGNMANFQEQIRNQVWKVLEPLIASNFSLDCNGDIVESDADSNGNLRGFIDSDDDEVAESEDDSHSEEDEEEEFCDEIVAWENVRGSSVVDEVKEEEEEEEKDEEEKPTSEREDEECTADGDEDPNLHSSPSFQGSQRRERFHLPMFDDDDTRNNKPVVVSRISSSLNSKLSRTIPGRQDSAQPLEQRRKRKRCLEVSDDEEFT